MDKLKKLIDELAEIMYEEGVKSIDIDVYERRIYSQNDTSDKKYDKEAVIHMGDFGTHRYSRS